MSPLVIVGSGLAGYTLAREFRKVDKATPLVIISADGGEAYSKPSLSNAFAQGKTPEALRQKTVEQVAEDFAATVLVRTTVTALDPANRTLSLMTPSGDKRPLEYDRLVLATGADPRPYACEGSDRVIVHSVNDLDDYTRWRKALQPEAKILLIGAGLIGAEFANDLAGAGYAVSMVDPAGWPLGRLLPEAMGDTLAEALRAVGISLFMGRSVKRLEPGAAHLDDGSVVAFDHVLSAIGLIPRVGLAQAAGLDTARGVRVDRYMQTSDRCIYALGDVAETAAGPLPFVLPLMAEARALAATLAGKPTALILPALPVVVKTPALAMVVCSPPPGHAGEWVVTGTGPDRKALFVSPEGAEVGFVLSGRHVSERMALAKLMPDCLGPSSLGPSSLGPSSLGPDSSTP